MLPDPVAALAPRLLVDDHEPFSLEFLSYRFVNKFADGFEREIDAVCVEFVLGWSGDIGHVVESEWVRICARRSGRRWCPTRVTTRPHGKERTVPSASGRVDLWVEPGKHGLTGADLSLPKDILEWMCNEASGWDGVFPSGPRSGHWGAASDRQARRLLRERAFVPSWRFSRTIDSAAVPYLPWDDFPAVLEERARETLAGVECFPSNLQVGDWGSAAPFVFVGPATYTYNWTCGGMSLTAALSRARSLHRQLVLPVAVRDIGALPELWSEAWDAYSSSLVLIVGTDAVARAAIKLGFHTACLVTTPDPDWDGGWVAVTSPELVELLQHKYQILGPGLADVVLDVNLLSLIGR